MGLCAAPDAVQVLLLNNERFLVPELAFHPGDIGLQQAGLPELLAEAALSQPLEVQVSRAYTQQPVLWLWWLLETCRLLICVPAPGCPQQALGAGACA